MGYDKLCINELLVMKQQLTDSGVAAICALHSERERVFDHMRVLSPTTDVAELREFAQTVELIEFELQAAWRFSVDRRFHIWWNLVPHCTTCHLVGGSSGDRVIDEDCPIHGK
jgi:hypothetical protein